MRYWITRLTMKPNLLYVVTSLAVLGQGHAIISRVDLERSFISQINNPVPLENITINFTHLGIWKYAFSLTRGLLSLDNRKAIYQNCSLYIISKEFKLECTMDISNGVAVYDVSKKSNWRLRWQHFVINANITQGALGVSLWLDGDTDEDAENIVCTVNVTRMSLMISPRRVSILPKVRAKFSESAATDIATKVKIGLENACMSASKKLREDWREHMLTESTDATDIASSTDEHSSDPTTTSSTDETLTVVSSTTETGEKNTSGTNPNANESDGSHDLTSTTTTTMNDMNEATTFSSAKTPTIVQAGETNTSSPTPNDLDSADSHATNGTSTTQEGDTNEPTTISSNDKASIVTAQTDERNTSSPSPNVHDIVDPHEANDTTETTDEDSKETTNVSPSDKMPTPGYSTAETSQENTSSPSPNADDTLGSDDNGATKTTDKDSNGATTIPSTNETSTALSSTSQTVEIKSSSVTQNTKMPDDQSSAPTEDVEHC